MSQQLESIGISQQHTLVHEHVEVATSRRVSTKGSCELRKRRTTQTPIHHIGVSFLLESLLRWWQLGECMPALRPFTRCL